MKPDRVSWTDEVWEAPVDEKGPPKCGDLLLQICCWVEDTAGGIPLNAEPDWQGKEWNPKTREEMREANGGITLLTELCLAMRSDPLGMIRGLGEVVTCIYRPAVTYACRTHLLRRIDIQWYT